jgi:uncharacterized membrane protein YedE/YeeE
VHQQLAWYVGGPLLGLCVVALRWLLNERLGATAAWSDAISRVSAREERLSVHGWLLVGLIFGGVVLGLFGPGIDGYGWLTDTFSAPVVVLVLALSGVLIGYGAKLAGGCTSGNGLSGTSMLSPAALAATGTFFATAIAVSLLTKAVF